MYSWGSRHDWNSNHIFVRKKKNNSKSTFFYKNGGAAILPIEEPRTHSISGDLGGIAVYWRDLCLFPCYRVPIVREGPVSVPVLSCAFCLCGTIVRECRGFTLTSCRAGERGSLFRCYIPLVERRIGFKQHNNVEHLFRHFGSRH